MFKKIILLSIFIGTFLFISGCGYTEEEKAHMKRLENQASINAINYIYEKYGFTPKVISADIETEDDFGVIPDFSPEPTDNVFVLLKHNNKTFEVYISGNEITNDGYDNYQFNEIVNDILNSINSIINISPYKSLIYYGEQIEFEFDEHNGLIKELYNGKNINDFLQNIDVYISLEFINEENFENIIDNELLKDFSFYKLIMVNYKSLDSYDQSLLVDFDDIAYFDDESFEEYIANIKCLYTYDDYYDEKELKHIDDIYYYTSSKYNNSTTLSYTTISDVNNWSDTSVNKNITQISNSYLVSKDFNSSYNKLYIYFPLSTFSNYSIEQIYAGIECGNNYFTSSGKIIGNHLVFSLKSFYCRDDFDFKFTLLYITN